MNLKTINNKNSIIAQIEQQYIKLNLPEINIGDTIKVGSLIQEGNKERIQYTEGVIIAKHNNHLNTTVNVRKIVQGIGVERVYLLHSPRIKSIEIIRHSKVRRAKLFYLRNRSGKATRLKQKFT
jgi:large subunit ribosomal protein L19|uniref:Large ribosomal subunit protein bL19c n=1 Tax=Kumanoa mahlacensis TaxID=1196387 RepID=A0A8K1YUH7_9FLOR|nr:ribosomal protein L19 [Kumanoa mahlacensis]